MLTVGIDPHKQTVCAVAVDAVGREVATRTEPARREGFESLLGWAAGLPDPERVWVIEDCRALSGSLERCLIDSAERVLRLAPQLMAGARTSVRQRGKSDPIDALAVARAALREGLDSLPAARLSGPELDIRLLAVHRERLVAQRTRLISELRWQCHCLWPEFAIPPRALISAPWQARVARRLAHTRPDARVQIARDLLRRVRELTRTINQLRDQLAPLVRALAPQLLAEPGIGVLIAAKLIGEIAGIDRFGSDAQLARMAGCAPIPVSSGNTSRHRLDRGGNRQLNHAIHMIALTKQRCHPPTILYLARQRARGKTRRDAIRSLKRHLIRRIFHLLRDPQTIPQTVCT